MRMSIDGPSSYVPYRFDACEEIALTEGVIVAVLIPERFRIVSSQRAIMLLSMWSRKHVQVDGAAFVAPVE